MRPLWWLVLATLLAGCAGQQGSDADDGSPTVEQDGSELESEERALPEAPPDGALPLSEIVAALEVAGIGPIVEIELEGGLWEVEHLVGGDEEKLLVDPVTGEVVEESTENGGEGS